MKQTAVEWLYGYLKMNNHIPSTRFNEKGLEQAKEMEKEHIINARDTAPYSMFERIGEAEEYYNETFKSE